MKVFHFLAVWASKRFLIQFSHGIVLGLHEPPLLGFICSRQCAMKLSKTQTFGTCFYYHKYFQGFFSPIHALKFGYKNLFTHSEMSASVLLKSAILNPANENYTQTHFSLLTFFSLPSYQHLIKSGCKITYSDSEFNINKPKEWSSEQTPSTKNAWQPLPHGCQPSSTGADGSLNHLEAPGWQSLMCELIR